MQRPYPWDMLCYPWCLKGGCVRVGGPSVGVVRAFLICSRPKGASCPQEETGMHEDSSLEGLLEPRSFDDLSLVCCLG